MLLSAEHITRSLGERVLLRDVSLYLDKGEKLGVIGANGAGKSTLLKLLAGAEEPEGGRVRPDPNVRLEYLPQDPPYDPDKTILDQVLSGLDPTGREAAEHEVKTVLTRLGVTGFERKMGTLSGGERRRAALAGVLTRPCDVLLLDEPTNHLDASMSAWLEDYLRRWRGALVMVTHDRYFLERVVDRMVEVEDGALTFYTGTYADYLERKAELLEMARAGERKRQSLLRRERQWVLQGAKARGTKSKERLERYEALKDREAPTQRGKVAITAKSSRLGKKTIELAGVSKAFAGRPVVTDFSFSLLRDDRVGVIGDNGSGKSTLLNLLAGHLSPDSGEVIVGETVKMGYFSQETPPMDPKERVIDYVKDVGNYIETAQGTLTASQLLEQFLFTGDGQYTPIGKLSGGERRRLFLLSVLASAPNVLLLDEPTNDLDIDTLTVLEDYLESFPGAVVAVSHDRYFLDKMARRTLLVDGAGHVTETPGGYSDWLESRKEPAAEKPARSGKGAGEKGSDAPEKRGGENRPQRARFSFKEQREFETIEGDIAALEQKLEELSAAQEAHATDYVELERLQKEQAETEAALEEKMERWVYLTELHEKILEQQKGK